jgi:hypothetical protein
MSHLPYKMDHEKLSACIQSGDRWADLAKTNSVKCRCHLCHMFTALTPFDSKLVYSMFIMPLLNSCLQADQSKKRKQHSPETKTTLSLSPRLSPYSSAERAPTVLCLAEMNHQVSTACLIPPRSETWSCSYDLVLVWRLLDALFTGACGPCAALLPQCL